MNLAIMLLIAAVSAPPDAVVENERYMALHREWQRIHESNANEKTPANAVFVIDPREGTVCIEKDRTIEARDTRVLPSGLNWSAYLITPQGVTQISFPVRLKRPRTNIQIDDDTEHIWIVGSAKDRSWQCSVSATPAGHAFHVGSGSPISSINVTIPVLKAAPKQDRIRDSMLIAENSRALKWADALRNQWFSVNLVRTATAP